MDICDTIPNPTFIPVTYARASRELRGLSYGTEGPAPKKLSEELECLHCSNMHQQANQTI
jgi:hypothetical protein